MKTIETQDLQAALDKFGPRYHVVAVFADDLSDAARQDARMGLSGGWVAFPEQGAIHFGRHANTPIQPDLLDRTVAEAARQRGLGVTGGPLLSMLIGDVICTVRSPRVGG